MKVKLFFKRLLAGLGIGTGAAIPGVSGAAIAVIFHVYEDIIGAVNNFKKKFKESIGTLLPILIGIVIAVLACIYAFPIAFQYIMFILICIFAGFLIGSFPGIVDEVRGSKPTIKSVLISCAGAAFVIILGILSIVLGTNGINVYDLFKDLNANWWIYIALVPIGVVAAVALTVPGLSGSLILLLLGFYRPLMDYTKGWAKEMFKGNFSHTGNLFIMLGCFAIGCLIGVVLVSKVMTKLLEKHRVGTFYAIIGFILGSIAILFINFDIFQYYQVWGGVTIEKITPALPIYVEIPIGIIVMGVCAFLSYLLVKYQRKHKEN